MDVSLLGPLLLTVAVLVGGFVFMANPDQEQIAKRAKAVAKSKDSTSSARKTLDPAAARRAKVAGNLKELENKEKAAQKARSTIRSRIQQAGLTISVATFWMMGAGAGVVIGLVALVITKSPLIAAGALFAGGFGFPQWVLNFLKGGRQKKFSAEFANAIEVIVRGVKSGLPLNECLKIIAREAPDPLKEEFTRLVDGLAMGVPLEQGLQRMYERMPLSEVNFFIIVLMIQQRSGGNLSEALGNLSTVLRSRKMLREKVKALSSEATASASIIGSLPIVVMTLVYVTSPSYIMALFTTSTGHFALMAGAGLMGCGVLVMKQMIAFDI